MSYKCGHCKKIVGDKMPCFTQHFARREEKRCENCYSLRDEHRARAKKSCYDLEYVLMKAKDELRITDFKNYDKVRILQSKIENITLRIDNNKKILKEN